MFSWMKKSAQQQPPEVFLNVAEGLKKSYRNCLLPLEEAFYFHDFHSPRLEDGDFDARPMIMLVGQYSTGKTTFIRYLLERDFPGMRVGPEPTTDSFTVVCHGEREGIVMGNALVVEPKKQFSPLSKYGNAFLNRFQACTVDSPVLRGITIIDTPGILSGEKQRVDRGYDFTGVLEWFAERVDRIILMFDAYKLDISDEFRLAIEAFRGHDDKIRIVLNKADMVEHQQLMRIYGALMWSLGKVLHTPEVSRVYIGSFWDRPHPNEINTRLFEDEEQDLFRDLQSLPRNATLRKLNDLIKRARLAKVHAYIISSLRKDMPSMFGKDGKKKELIKGLSTIYEQLQREHQISPGDFPDIKKMQECLPNHDFTKFNPLKPRLLEVVDKMLAEDISRLMAQIPHEDVIQAPANLHGGAFEGVEDTVSPFGYKRGEGIDAGHGEPEWIVSKKKFEYDAKFESLGPINGKVSGEAAKSEMVKSKLPKTVLGKIWKLADIDKDGFLDTDEFALAMHLIEVKLDGHDLPATLPDHLLPPSKRQSTLSAFTVRKPPMPPIERTPVEGPRLTPVKKRIPIPPVTEDSTRIKKGLPENKECATPVKNGLPEDNDKVTPVKNGSPEVESSQPNNGLPIVEGPDTEECNSPQENVLPPKRTVVLKHKVLPEGGLRSYFETCSD